MPTDSFSSQPLDGLLDLACRDGIDVRPTLLRVLTDLYVQKPRHGADEETQYVELALGLIDTVDEATRKAVDTSLARYPRAPAAVLAKLGRSPAATSAADEYPAAAEAQAKAQAEAEQLVDIFFGAGSDERRLILLNLDVAVTRPVRLPAPAPSEVINRLESAALSRNVGEFSRALGPALDIRRDLAERIARDLHGEPIVVAAKALGMKAAMLQRILLFLNPAVGQSAQRVFDLSALFDELPVAAALHLVAIWRRARGGHRAVHAPIYAADAAPDARVNATPQVRRTGRPPAVLPSLGQIVG